MTRAVKFGLNVFEKPDGFVFGAAHDFAQWRADTRARRERAGLEAQHLQVNGQELTPQHQKQQLLAKVAVAKRADLARVFTEMFPRPRARLEPSFELAQRRGVPPAMPRSRNLLFSEAEMRAQLQRAIARADSVQLTHYSKVLRSLAAPHAASRETETPLSAQRARMSTPGPDAESRSDDEYGSGPCR